MALWGSFDPLCNSVLERGDGWGEMKDVQEVAGSEVGCAVWVIICVCLQKIVEL